MTGIDRLYDICIILGILLPTLSLIVGGIDSIFDFDFELDGDADVGFIGFNFNCLMFASALLGGVGKICADYEIPEYASLLIAIVSGFVGYTLLYRLLVLPLKRNNSEVKKQIQAIGEVAIVRVKIPINGTGEVSLEDTTGCVITYLAQYKYNEDEEIKDIPINTQVKVIDIENNVLITARYFNKN